MNKKGKTRRPIISILMSTHNDERYIAESIQSILSQSITDFEFIIVNDGSSDNTLKILKEYSQKDKRIIIINNHTNLGLIKSLNKGLKISKGKYVARMDADDVSLPNRLKVQYEYLEKNKNIFLVGTYSINIDENGSKISLSKPPTEPWKIKKDLEKNNCMRHSSIMFRNTGKYFYREKMWHTEDYDFYTLLITSGKKIANIPEYLLKYRRLSNSISFSKRGIQTLFGMKAGEFFLQRLKSGKDDYDSFDPKEFLNLDMDKITNKRALTAMIIASFSINDLEKTRELALKYFKHHGLTSNPKIFLYYYSTFINKNVLKKIKVLIHFLMRKY